MSKTDKGDPRQPLLDFPQPDQSFESLIVTQANKSVVSVLKNTEHWPKSALAVTGPPASGKTAHYRAWAQAFEAETISAGGFSAAKHAEIEKLSSIHVAIDDAQDIENEDNLLSLLNLSETRGGRILLTAAERLGDWRVKSADLESRLRSMPVLEISPPDEETFALRLQAAAERRFIRLRDDVKTYLIRRLGWSYSGLEAYMSALSDAVSSQDREATVHLAREVLEAGGAFDYSPRDDDGDG